MVKQTVIITAGGIGKRMNSDLPKQFLPIQGEAILAHTIKVFYTYNQEIQIILTLPKEWLDYWQEYISKNHFKIIHSVVEGGIERYDSIKNALEIATGELIAVHDGVRPMLSQQTIMEGFDLADKKGNAVPTFPIKESIRKVLDNRTESVLRKDYSLVQTPQVFQQAQLRKAYEIHFHPGITDDASLVEEAGFKIHVYKGNEENIKITSPIDLILAEHFFAK
jgi:2-C-methyl-D-erythritol 4-phosphate cytidylyltransferase